MYKAFFYLLLAAFGLAACGGAPETQEAAAPEARPIVPYKVVYARDSRTVQAVGTARARAATNVTPETAGIVEAVLFEAGDTVEAGQPLLTVDADDERLAVKLAEVSVREAEQLLARYRRIENTGAVSDSAIDEARTQLEAARINLEQARLRLEERTVRAPFAGVVGLTDLDPGTRVAQDTVITALDDRSFLYIDFNVPEDVFGQLKPGTIVDVAAFSENDRVRQAEVISLDNRIDPNSRSFRVRAAIANEDDALRPGMSFDVRFAIEGKRYPTVPEAAIVWGSNGAYLWAVRDGLARQVPVQIVSRRDGMVLVDGDLPEGSLIVAEGVQKVREGTEITFPSRRLGPTSGITAGSVGQ